MTLRQRLYDIDDLWELVCQDDTGLKHYELIDGALIEMSPPGGRHGLLATKFARYLDIYAETLDLGLVTVETGYHPPDNRHTLLSPDVAFVSKKRAPQPFPEKFVPLMPDLAVEIVSPSNSVKELRRKAAIYLQNGAQLVWIVVPGKNSVEVCRMKDGAGMTREIVESTGTLSGEQVLPGFALDMKRLFA